MGWPEREWSDRRDRSLEFGDSLLYRHMSTFMTTLFTFFESVWIGLDLLVARHFGVSIPPKVHFFRLSESVRWRLS